jgi:hypothetical protein
MVSDGFLQIRAGLLQTDPSFPLHCPGSDRLGIFNLGEENNSHWDDLNGRDDPIHTRGWCFQQYFLSMRSLVFTFCTLQYHCYTATYNVGGAICNASRFFRSPLQSSPKYRKNFDWSVTPSSGPLVIETPWERYVSGVLDPSRNAVNNYSRRTTTKPGDKLIALAGVVEWFNKLRRGRYLAGLWKIRWCWNDCRSCPVSASSRKSIRCRHGRGRH